MTNLRLLGVAALALASTACDDDPLRACTLIGCDDGIAVRIEGALPAEYTVTVSSVAGGTRSRTCSPAAPCIGGAVRFESYAPAEVTVTLTWASGAVAVTVQPAYEVSRPNGPDCPPECRNATITLQVS